MPLDIVTGEIFRVRVRSVCEAVEGSGVRCCVERHGSRPQAPRRIALAVVEAVARDIPFRIGDRDDFFGIEIQGGDPVVEGDHDAGAGMGDNGSDRLAGRDGAVGAGFRVVEVELVVEDAHPKEKLALRVPDSPFAQAGRFLDDDFEFSVFVGHCSSWK